MGAIDDLSGDELRALVKRIEKLERAAPVGFSTVSRGALRITSEEGLIVEGSESVTGTLTVSGLLNADGTIILTGPVTISGATDITGPLTVTGDTDLNGDTTVNGPLHVAGATDVTGTLGIKGASTLEGDLNITGGGKIVSGVLFIDSGGEINSSDTLQLKGAIRILMQAFEIEVGGNFTAFQSLSNPGIFTKSGATANVHIDSNGRFWQVP